ncbi:MAG: hypothetical protein KJO07_25795 [Deltaproteobacteria bacterium]|nr:hypothetical protein [Deltaproteobacteria bacterium]
MNKAKPTRAPTHTPVELGKLMKLAGDLEDIASDGRVREDDLLELAEDNGISPELYYAALPVADMEVGSEAPAQFVVCVGGCQGWGSLECIERLLDDRDDTNRYAIGVRECLDRCERAAVVEVRSKDGTAVLTEASPEQVAEAARALD